MHIASLSLFDLPAGYRRDFHAEVKRGLAGRLHPVPPGSANLAFVGQYCEIPDNVVYTVEYSVQSAAPAVASHPRPLLDKAAMIAGGAGMLLAELLKSDDPPSPFKGPFALAKRVAWSEPVAIADVKTIGALAGAKVDGVLVAGMTGALRAYLKRRGVDTAHTTLYVAGVPIERVMFWVPHPGENLGMGISILSYGGFATLAIVADARLVPDPEAITRAFQREFVTLHSAARRAGARSMAGTHV